MAATVIQTATGTSPTSDNGANSTSCAATFGTSPATGDLLIASFCSFAAGLGAQVITPPTGWTELPTVDGPNPLDYIVVWVGYRYRQAGDSNTVTFTVSAANASALMLREITGMVTSSPLDVGGMLGSYEGAPPYMVTSGSGTAAAVSELILLDAFTELGDKSTTSWSAPSGFTADTANAVTSASGSAAVAGWHAQNASTALAAQTVTETTGVTYNIDMIVTQYAIKPLAGTTHNVTEGDTASTVADALSLGQLPYPPTAPDQASAFADAVQISVQQSGGAGGGQPHVHFFRRGNWL